MNNEELKHMRASMNLTQDEFAELIHVHKMTVSRWERGTTKIPEYIADLIRYRYADRIKRKWIV